MKARPGPTKKIVKMPGGFVPPKMPKGLTPRQKEAFHELVSSPFLVAGDSASIYEYMDALVLRDAALAQMTRTPEEGAHPGFLDAEGRPSGAFRVWKEAQDRILRLRTSLLATPKERVKAQVSGADPEPEDDGFAELVG